MPPPKSAGAMGAGNSMLLRCCVPHRLSNSTLDDSVVSSPAGNKVELAASELFSLPGCTAYHTSVVVNGEEFFFTDSGIFSDRTLMSHQSEPSERMEIGWSRRTGAQMLRALSPHFSSGTYDLVRKNCNSCSDAALYFLLGTRLDGRFSVMERLGQRLNHSLLQRATKGMYQPNEAAKNFRVEDVLKALDQLRDEDLLEGPHGGSESNQCLSMGTLVTIVGLKNWAHLNGHGAQVVCFSGVTGRWQARLNSTGEVKAFRAENLRPAGEVVVEAGDTVRIHGLKSDSGQALNGRECVVVRYLHDSSRYEVRFPDGCTKAVRGANLKN